MSRCLATAAIPSACGMFVYREETSAVTSIALSGRGGVSCIVLIKCVVSLMKAGIRSASGCKKCVMYLLKLSVGLSKPETIGRSGMLGLCILGSP